MVTPRPVAALAVQEVLSRGAETVARRAVLVEWVRQPVVWAARAAQPVALREQAPVALREQAPVAFRVRPGRLARVVARAVLAFLAAR